MCSSLFRGRANRSWRQERAQGLDRGLIERGKKATERRTCRQAVASKERHERAGPGLDLLVESFQRAFTADSIAEEHGEKIDHLVPPEAATGKAHLLADVLQNLLAVQVVCQESDFLEYVIMPLSLIVWLVEAIREVVLHLLLSN